MSRESGIEKKIEIVMNLGNYESLRIGASFSETITWSSVEERKTKSDKITDLLISEIKKDIAKVNKDLCLKERASDYSNAFEAISGGGSNSDLDQVEEGEDFEV